VGLAVWIAVTAALGADAETDVQRYIKAASALFQSLDDERALQQLAQAKALPHQIDDSILISLYEGLILSDAGRTAESEAAFREAFALDPDARLPAPASPKLEAWIERIRASVKLRLARVPEPPKPPSSDTPAAPVLAPTPAASPPVVTAPERSASLATWVPAVTGAVLLAGAGTCWALEQGVESRLRAGDPSITTSAQLNAVVRSGRTYTAVGWTLGGLGGAGVLTAAGIATFGHRTPSVGVTFQGSSPALMLSGAFP
jgi:hypothetical protein